MVDNIDHKLPPTPPVKETTKLPKQVVEKIDEQATQFEAMFMSQMLQFMWSGIEANETFGGGAGENTWNGMLLQEYGNVSAKAGNLGIADAVRGELIRAQEKILSPAQADAVMNGATVNEAHQVVEEGEKL